jgi:hypothetical protein
LVDITLQVFNSHDLEEERREQSNERRQAKLMAAAIGDAPYAQKTSSDKKDEKLPCFKCKKLGLMVGNCPEPPQRPCHECPKTGGYQWHWRMDCPCSQRGAWPAKTLGVLAKVAHDLRRPRALSTTPT